MKPKPKFAIRAESKSKTLTNIFDVFIAKRLFLFAGYNKLGNIDDALVYYIKALSKFGDIVLAMDSNCADTELKKIQPYCLYTSGARHGEYDFGSYKRAYAWASENLDLSQYDFIYLVNDSVYGPLFDMTEYFDKMEHMGCHAFGLVKNPHKRHPHIQSWFIGLTPSVFKTKWFDKFMHNITKLKSKGAITRKYEQGLSNLITNHNLTWDCIHSAPGRSVYNRIKYFYRSKMPFIKKVAFIRHNGALGMQISYVLNHISQAIRDIILHSARNQYGEKYIDWLLTRNPFKILLRNISYVFHKLSPNGG